MLDLDAYFERIGYSGPRAASEEVLTELQRLHPAAIPFENLNTLLGWPVPLELEALQRKLVAGGRGGYCFEQNVLFAAVLEALGHRVRALAARVVWNRGLEDAAAPLPQSELGPRTHMALLVECGARTLLCDVGFGGLTLNVPLAFEIGREQRGPQEVFRLVRRAGEITVQARLEAGWRSLYRFELQPQLPMDIAMANHYVATHPESPMRATLMAARSGEDARYALRDNTFTVRAAGGEAERRLIRDAAELRGVLEGAFRIAVPQGEAVDALLARVAALS